MSFVRARLLELFKGKAFSFGKFKLVSGRESDYYIDSKKAILSSAVVDLLGRVLWDATIDLHLDAAGGPEVGAIPMATLLAQRYSCGGRKLEGFFVRKQPKGHGSGNRIEGNLQPGMRVCVLEDVVTTGASVLQACDEIEKAGATIVRVVCLVDRLEGASEAIGSRYDFRPVFTIRDFGVEP